MAATVVWCQSCKTAVWAYDQMRESQDIRGLLNMISMPCPKCGQLRHFDGWSGDDLSYFVEKYDCYDWWSALKTVFHLSCKDGTWEISPDCSWFKRPERTDEQYSRLIEHLQEGIREDL
ncbi:MAG: hypothetical protein ACXABY_30965 [Candidatus Thorarchaeota archaeon]|jgi:hypothetical protein